MVKVIEFSTYLQLLNVSHVILQKIEIQLITRYFPILFQWKEIFHTIYLIVKFRFFCFFFFFIHSEIEGKLLLCSCQSFVQIPINMKKNKTKRNCTLCFHAFMLFQHNPHFKILSFFVLLTVFMTVTFFKKKNIHFFPFSIMAFHFQYEFSIHKITDMENRI